MDDLDDFKDILQRFRYEIVQRLQLDRTSMFDYLRSKGVFDANDCEIVVAEKTREQKASKFLDLLESKGREGFVYFIEVLQLLNPGLYESITGKKANPCRIWENMRDKFALGNCGYVPDVELLSGQLKRTIDDLQDLALRNQQLLKENQNLGMKLDQASTDLDLKHRRVEILEKAMNDSERGVVEAHNNANKLNEAVAQQLRTLQQGIFERNTYIIALQMKLLATEEEIKETKRLYEELKSQHELLSSKWHELSRDYDHERRESMKLSAKLKSQRGNLQKAGEFERRCREFKQINEQMMAERDESLTELDNLKDWTEALKARYDIIVDEYKQLQQSFVTGATESCKLKEEIEELKLQLSLSKIGVEDLKSWNEELEETVKKYREQRDFFSETRKAALLERDSARLERDEAVERYSEVLRNRDEAIAQQTKHSQHFEEKYEKACVELKSLRERIASAELELEELRIQRKKTTSDYDSDMTSPPEKEATNTDNLDSTTSEESAKSPSKSPCSPTLKLEGFSWKTRREAKSIIQSVRRRVRDGTQHKGFSLDRKLDQIKVDGSETLAEEARTSLNLQRGNLLFKTPPSYNTLRFMFGLSVGGHMGSFADISGCAGAGAGAGAGAEYKDSSENCQSSSSTTDTSQDEILRDFDTSLDLDGYNNQNEPSDVTITDSGASKGKITKILKPWPYIKSHSEPILKVKRGLIRGQAIEQDSDEDSEKSDEFKDTHQENETNDDLDGEDFHWVQEHECLPKSLKDDYSDSNDEQYKKPQTKEEVDEFFKSLSRMRKMPFRQRACAMKKKYKRRSSSAPTILSEKDTQTTKKKENK